MIRTWALLRWSSIKGALYQVYFLYLLPLSHGDISNDIDGPVTQLSRLWHFWSRISQATWTWTTCPGLHPIVLGTKFLYNTNRKSYAIYQMVPLSITLSDLWPGFQGHDIFWSRISEKRCVLKTKLLLHKRKLYVTHGMVLCLVTLVDL